MLLDGDYPYSELRDLFQSQYAVPEAAKESPGFYT